jgi:hypothetical protein
MSPHARRRLLIAAPVLVLGLMGVAVLLLVGGGRDLKSRAASISVRMSRAQVETLLGPPVLDMDRTGGRGTTLVWVDQLWQVDVQFGRDGRVESIGCVPSDSFVRRTLGRIGRLLR